MSNDLSNPAPALLEAVRVLRGCQPLAERLVMHGITVKLNDGELANLLKFEQLVLADYSDREWSYLRVASGVKVSGVAALTSYLARYRMVGKQQ